MPAVKSMALRNLTMYSKKAAPKAKKVKKVAKAKK